MWQQKLATERCRECSSEKLRFRRLITDSIKERFLSSILSLSSRSLFSIPFLIPVTNFIPFANSFWNNSADIYPLSPQTVSSKFFSRFSTGVRSFSFAGVSVKLCSFPDKSMAKCSLKPKNHPTELLPNFLIHSSRLKEYGEDYLRYNNDPKYKAPPEEFKTDEWWKKRGL